METERARRQQDAMAPSERTCQNCAKSCSERAGVKLAIVPAEIWSIWSLLVLKPSLSSWSHDAAVNSYSLLYQKVN
jgi:hypothetical protein